jgi:septal ring factor EnvC (AmiA/AmiB activator)
MLQRCLRVVGSVRLVLMVIAVVSAGCQTTGDPTQGGLFGWSEKKAQQRQQGLEQQNADAQGQLVSAQQQQSQLRRQEAGLQTQSAQLRGEIDRLMTENDHLENQLRTLAHQHDLGEAELTRLNALLAQNERMRELIRTGNPAAAVPDEQPKLVNEQNNQLHHEIMLLLNR